MLGTLLVVVGVVPVTALVVDRAPEGVPVGVGGLVVPPGVAIGTEIGVTGGWIVFGIGFCFVVLDLAVAGAVLFVVD